MTDCDDTGTMHAVDGIDDLLELVPLAPIGSEGAIDAVDGGHVVEGPPSQPLESLPDDVPPLATTLVDLGARQLGLPPDTAVRGVASLGAPPDGTAIALGGPAISAATFVRTLLAMVAVAVLAAVGLNAWVDPLGIVHRDPAGALSEEPAYRVWKRQLVDRLAAAPQVVLLGSSTSRDLDPQLVRSTTGRSTFNASVVGGSPLDAWVLEQRLRQRFPKATPHLVYGVDVDLTFRDADPSPALLRDAGLREQLTRRELLDVGATVLRPYLTLSMTRTSLRQLRTGRPASAPRTASSTFRPDGFRLLDPYRHVHLRLRLPRETARFADLMYRDGSYRTLGQMPRTYLERTIVDANRHGDVPTFVLMPIQPWAAAQLGPMGQRARHALVLGWFRDMAKVHRLRVVDLTDIASFRGTADGFRDNVHLAPANATAVVRELAARGAYAAD